MRAGGVGGVAWLQTGAVQSYSYGTGGAEVHVPLADHMGNVRHYYQFKSTKGNVTGQLVASYEYDAFGREVRAWGLNTPTENQPPGLPASRPWADLLPFHYSSKLRDVDSGFNYYGYRFYDPGAGRWLNRDPIGEEGGVNLYGMVGNDAVNWIDYLGFQELPADWTNSQPPWGGGRNSRGNCWRHVCNAPAKRPADHSAIPPGYDPKLPIDDRCKKLVKGLKERGAYDLKEGPCYCSPEDRIISVQLSDERIPKDPWGKPTGPGERDYHFEFAPHYGLNGPWKDKPGFRPEKPSDGKGDNNDGRNDGYKECGKLCLPKGTQP
jgi:RHS repeat-associated protein